MDRQLTEAERRELEIVSLAYELQDEFSDEECDPRGPLDEKYYHMAAVELGYEKEDGNEVKGSERPVPL